MRVTVGMIVGQIGARHSIKEILPDYPYLESKLGAHNASDSAIMAFAAANNYMVLTHDLDFSAILAATRGEKPSVVQIRAEDVSPDVISKQVIVALRQMATELEDGPLLTIEPNRTRLRVLPLQSRG
jgi:predicted nuclease of predicted toxin-antitoxin system